MAREANTWHWEKSCKLNALIGGDPTEPLCSRVYRQPDSVWRTVYFEVMDWYFRETHHCARIYGEWALAKGYRWDHQIA